jgi:hypothetical protein
MIEIMKHSYQEVKACFGYALFLSLWLSPSLGFNYITAVEKKTKFYLHHPNINDEKFLKYLQHTTG